MPQKLVAKDFIEKAKFLPVLDVRSPGEFKKGHVPGANSMCLFTDEERAKVGTCYKQIGKDKAVEMGLEFVGPKLIQFVKTAKKYALNGEILVYCWRGGMRSGSMAWLLETAGLKVYLLEGGYKAYRNYVLSQFSQELKLCVLGGKTGSGKTELLHVIKSKGHQVLDLEGIAKHRGSAFGHFGMEPQPSSEQFENLLAKEILALDVTKPIWVEDESRHIGKVFMDVVFYTKIRTAPILFMDISVETRLPHLVKVYAGYPKEDIVMALDKIQRRLGGQWHQLALKSLDEGNFAEVAKITLTYYDKAYMFGLHQRENPQIRTVEVNTIDPNLQYEAILPLIKEF